MNFETYGPFALREWSNEARDELYADIEAAKEGLQDSIGVYIVACKQGAKLLPWYVGKTHNGFGIRLKRHFFDGPFKTAYERNGNLSLFLIARASPNGRLKERKKGQPVKQLKSIDQLEFALIGTCLVQDPELLNKQEKTFHQSIIVPGYLNSPSREDKSAKSLAKLLGTKV